MRFAIALVVALLSQPAWARQDDEQHKPDRRPPAAQSKDIPGYGYGTQHGQEANGGARQSTRKAAKKSTAPQDERGAAASRAAEQEGSATASGSRSAERAHAKPARTGRARAKSTNRARGAADAASAPAAAPQR